uniref:Uncharacterized protein n=1 Tax=Moniliophthora roreri TaxID=221103 RepID=A0A0W0F1X9_MONRR
MTSRAARQFFSSSLRSAARPAFRAQHAGRRGMSSTPQEVKKGSDMPWIIGSAVVFGPAVSTLLPLDASGNLSGQPLPLQLLYLVSPSSRKTAPHVAHDKHDKHGHGSQSHAPLPMKDDEGTVADVSGSVAKAEACPVAEDAPQSDAAPTEQVEAKEDKSKEDKPEEKSEGKSEDKSEEKKSAPLEKEKKGGEVQFKNPAGAKSDPGPTNQGEARTASVGHEAPKTLDEKVEESSSK